NSAAGDSRFDRVQRTADERRRVHGGAVRFHCAARERRAGGRLRPRSPLQRPARGDAGGWRRNRGAPPASPPAPPPPPPPPPAHRPRGAQAACRDRRRRRPYHVCRCAGPPGRCAEGLMSPDELKFEAEFAAERAPDEPALVVDVEGFEGPLDLLLTLARHQKVDLAKISILALADQYLAFIEEARRLRLEPAPHYLVVAAPLPYLETRLLSPR